MTGYEPFGSACTGELLSPGLLWRVMTSKTGPSLLRAGGVDAFSYSAIRL